MVKVNTDWLEELGVQAANKLDLHKLLDWAANELEMRVGHTILDSLTDEQISEFQNTDDANARLKWIEKTYPDYKSVVHVHYHAMSEEIKNAEDKHALITSWTTS
jgi:hypothetical protein